MFALAEPIIVAHRGASADAPENTLPAFRLAWQQGADAIEGDFHLTADGHIICLHDVDTKKTAGIEKRVAATSLAELRQLEVGSWFSEHYAGTGIPTLAEVMATLPAGKRIFIEIKCGPEVIPQLTTEIKASGLGDQQLTVISFNAAVIAAFKERFPYLQAYWLTDIQANEQGEPQPTAAEALAVVQSIRADGISTRAHPSIDRAYVSTFLDAGFSYHVWTVNDPAVARRFLDFWVSSVTTDKPGFMRATLAGK
jgi:glycerophosphoryl diester phosphodiesterase